MSTQNVALDTGRRNDTVLRQSIEQQCAGMLVESFYVRNGKRLLDLSLALPALAVLSVPMVLLALIIRLDSPGSPLFRQYRTGQYGRRFAMYKYRTMVEGAEELKADLLSQNVHGAGSPDFKLVDDPRLTRLGRFLRETSIDELPNLLNVIKGDMSLVGPRPTSFEPKTYAYQHLPRLGAKPGITGVWQVSGRANVDFDRRAIMDQRYIRNVSLRLDLRLILKTLRVNNHGAY